MRILITGEGIDPVVIESARAMLVATVNDDSDSERSATTCIALGQAEDLAMATASVLSSARRKLSRDLFERAIVASQDAEVVLDQSSVVFPHLQQHRGRA